MNPVTRTTKISAQRILEMSGIDKQFNGVYALKNCRLELRPGEVHALVGENGAGKSTMMKILAGIYQKDAGTVTYMGHPVEFKDVRQAQAAGIHIVHQELNMMNQLTVAQNIFIGREGRGLMVRDAPINEKTRELMALLGISIEPDTLVGALSVGKQQMVEIAKAISFDSKILVFDEPTAALTESEIVQLFKVIDDLRRRNVSMVYISHRMVEIKQIADRVTVMRDGEYVGTRNTADVEIDEIVNMMVGRTIYEEPKQQSAVAADARCVLEVKGLSSMDVEPISFEVREGEILGFAGLMGAGRTETARLLFGADPCVTGEIFIEGKKVNIRCPRDAVKMGIGYLSEDRKRYGLTLGLSVSQNIVLSSLEFFSQILIKDKEILNTSAQYVDTLKIKTPTVEQVVKTLSGGNQQKVVLAKWLLRDCKVLIFDEPTRGIDVGAKSEIYHLMNELAKSGKSIIMISSEMPELLRMSDRIIVMCEGKKTATLDIGEATPELIMHYATLH